MKERNRKNILIYLSTMLILLSLLHNKAKKTDVDFYDEGTYNLYSTYSRGNIYICDSVSGVKNVCEVCDESDVVVVDQSDYKDPNMKIISSYKITDREEMKEILNIIKEYCTSKDSSWDRSIDAMQNEWIIHNMCSSLFIKKDRADDVDLNNADEKVYKSKIITKILGN